MRNKSLICSGVVNFNPAQQEASDYAVRFVRQGRLPDRSGETSGYHLDSRHGDMMHKPMKFLRWLQLLIGGHQSNKGSDSIEENHTAYLIGQRRKEGSESLSGEPAKRLPTVLMPRFMKFHRRMQRLFGRDRCKGGSELLIWAVTGAGKTEVVFHAIDAALRMGKQVLVATPRKDVVLELVPRFQKAFPSQSIIALHGESSQKGEIGPFVVATTHQAINFYRYFDLVILDEVDAFPFHNNPMLHFAVDRARTRDGQIIYLTATPPRELLQRVRQGIAEVVHIPCRHHGYPLVIPELILDPELRKRLARGELPKAIGKFVTDLFSTGRQGFIFVPKIDWVGLLVDLLQSAQWIYELKAGEQKFTTDSVDGTYANDPQRGAKVERFRQGKIRLLVTTTILERGVTIPGTDCLVCSADASVFDESSLVQIAGRVGRSADDPTGRVLFLAEEWTQAIRDAIRQIKRMNRLARKKGYLWEKWDWREK